MVGGGGLGGFLFVFFLGKNPETFAPEVYFSLLYSSQEKQCF